mmetsp:Transcript_158/g.465  ORF Transcript_158/g.465 Transcript_158/m.465 type:complete len:91 (+) Transcript_158:957-1229(+)
MGLPAGRHEAFFPESPAARENNSGGLHTPTSPLSPPAPATAGYEMAKGSYGTLSHTSMQNKVAAMMQARIGSQRPVTNEASRWPASFSAA